MPLCDFGSVSVHVQQLFSSSKRWSRYSIQAHPSSVTERSSDREQESERLPLPRQKNSNVQSLTGVVLCSVGGFYI